MKIEKLNNDKVKVTLTADELIRLDIDVDSLGPNSKELHTFLFRIMETIREETGFNPYNGQVVVEASPMRGGISILVSKLPAADGALKYIPAEKGFSVRARKKKKTSYKATFCFDDFDDLCKALTELADEELYKSSLYRVGSIYYFVTAAEGDNLRCLAVMTEFSAGRPRSTVSTAYMEEHGTLVAKCAALAEMAHNLRRLT